MQDKWLITLYSANGSKIREWVSYSSPNSYNGLIDFYISENFDLHNRVIVCGNVVCEPIKQEIQNEVAEN